MNALWRITLSIALVLGGLSAGVPTLAQTDLEPGPVPLAEQEVFGFLPYWELARAASIDFGVLTTLAWFGVEASRDGQLIRGDADGEPTRGWACLLYTSDAADDRPRV